jgi:hypothetical protein
MAGYWVPSDYGILLTPSGTGIDPCPTPTGVAGTPGCFIVRSLTTQPALVACGTVFYCGTGLTYTYSLPDSGGASMVLAGSITATQAGSLSSVYTVGGFCQNGTGTPTTQVNVSPVSCTATPASEISAFLYISGALLKNQPISVLAGQIVQVTVTISFS